ncbi:hypothetical protein QBC40DRAFT_322823 [Triangularia verruculosa]|uniref:Uncharacterized protein n=1 Tax=Triangularia verruculosa TaxID=2587418 RepID=A0AAN6XNZ4_9PEZI|nr:hypothetical protein QBC40DRAFT_322823 [Triangularia verruculosa]
MRPAKTQGSEAIEEDPRPVNEIWNGFIDGKITPWRHQDYLQMVYLTLLLPENEDRGLVEIASDFAAKMDYSRQHTSILQHQSESRTKTVFWFYQVKQGIDPASNVYRDPNWCFPPPFILVREIRPELLNPKLIDEYYTVYLQSQDYFQRYYVLPDIKPLEPPSKAPKSIFGVGNNTAPEPFEHERYLNMAFAMVQRYLREGETRRRSWFIERGFDALRQEFMRIRASGDSGLQPFSETKAYFHVQLVHIALSHFTVGGHHDTVQKLTYHTFKLFFNIESDIWRKHYSVKLWTSPKALGRFQPPDLKPLPDTVLGSFKIENSSLATALGVSQPSEHTTTPSDLLNPTAMNEVFRKVGLEPEVPLREVISFHQTILLEDAKSIDTTVPLSPSNLPTPAHLFKYIYTNLLTAGSMSTLPTRASHLLSTLFHHASPNIPQTHLLFYLNYLLNFCTPGIELAYPGILPPTRLPKPDYIDDSPHSWREKIKFHPITTTTRTNPDTNKVETVHTRYHDCPCHNGGVMPYFIGPSACEYPVDFPYEHPPQLYHGCDCYKGEMIDQDRLAEIVAGMYAEREDGEKRRGEVYGGGFAGENGKRKVGEELFLEWLGRWPELALVEFGRGGKEGDKRGLLKLWEGREGVIQLLTEKDGNVSATGVQVGEEGEEEDGETLAGDWEVRKNDEEEEDWEVLSQAGTLCDRAGGGAV